MSGTEFRHYTRGEFLDEFFPDGGNRAAIAAGMGQLRCRAAAGFPVGRTGGVGCG